MGCRGSPGPVGLSGAPRGPGVPPRPARRGSAREHGHSPILRGGREKLSGRVGARCGRWLDPPAGGWADGYLLQRGTCRPCGPHGRFDAEACQGRDRRRRSGYLGRPESSPPRRPIRRWRAPGRVWWFPPPPPAGRCRSGGPPRRIHPESPGPGRPLPRRSSAPLLEHRRNRVCGVSTARTLRGRTTALTTICRGFTLLIPQMWCSQRTRSGAPRTGRKVLETLRLRRPQAAQNYRPGVPR